MLSSIGGTVRLGELVPGGVIRHAIKVELDGSANYYRIGTDNPNGYRWPATTADWCATHPPYCYGGAVSELRMGSLLALRPEFNITALETEPARILAHALQDYGGYTVDNAGWSVYTIATEFSPDGDVINEFAAKWGFPLGVAANANTNWSRDLHAIFGALHVIKNWNASVWSTVSASNGTQGAGSGAPRVPWAPPFGQAPAKVIGTTTAYDTTLTVYADNKWGNRYTLSEQGSFTKVSAYLDGAGPGSGGEVLRAVIYADSGGVPGALRATTATSTIAHGQAAGWVDFSISPAVTLPPGDYWLTLQAGAVTQGARRYGVAQTGFEKWNLDAFSDGPADPFGTANTGDWRWSLYATYNPSPPPPSPRTIGTTTVYNNTLSVYADNKWGNRYTLSEPGSFTKMSAYLDGLGPGTGGEVLRALIYADSGGIPGALRAASATVTIADGQAARWVDFSISPAVTLQPGDYWLVLQAGAVSQAALRYGVAQTGFEKWNLDAFSDGAANPFGTANTGDWRWSLFATYTARHSARR